MTAYSVPDAGRHAHYLTWCPNVIVLPISHATIKNHKGCRFALTPCNGNHHHKGCHFAPIPFNYTNHKGCTWALKAHKTKIPLR